MTLFNNDLLHCGGWEPWEHNVPFILGHSYERHSTQANAWLTQFEIAQCCNLNHRVKAFGNEVV
jgi:hypothetical protein